MKNFIHTHIHHLTHKCISAYMLLGIVCMLGIGNVVKADENTSGKLHYKQAHNTTQLNASVIAELLDEEEDDDIDFIHFSYNATLPTLSPVKYSYKPYFNTTCAVKINTSTALYSAPLYIIYKVFRL
jgi:hypothetical protein